MKKMILPILCAFLISACTNNIDSDNQNPTNAKTVTALGETQVSNGDYQTDPAQIKAVLEGGRPLGRWNEGLMFEGVKPMPWQKSASNWFPNTEDVQPEEIRIIFMGSSPVIRPGQ